VIDLLSGVRVVECGALLNAATVGMRLADLGAEVIKLERPGIGSYGRSSGGHVGTDLGVWHVQVNKNKRSITLDLRQEAGREAFWRLLDTADVFVDGNAYDACDKLGIGYEAQRERKPGIVYCQYTGFGAFGPYAALPTHGQMMDALAGAQRRTMGPDGFLEPAEPGPDTTLAGGEGTAAGAVHAALAVTAALVRRQRTGEGAYLDVAGYEGVFAQAWVSTTQALNRPRVINPEMMAGPEKLLKSARYQYYETADGEVLLFCAMERKFWNNFCDGAERPDLRDGGAGSQFEFGEGGDDLRREIQSVIVQRTLAEWMRFALEHDVQLGPAPRTTVEALEDPHVRARGMALEGVHAHGGAFTYVAPPVHVGGQTYAVERLAPSLGEHTLEVLRELGYDDASLEALSREGVI
jgi:crotonobetainyl-CoA:carnitine CoA-transferase CaiB-like acyl-CoA transferase